MKPSVALAGALLVALVIPSCKKKQQGQDAQSGYQQGQSGGQYGPGPATGPGPSTGPQLAADAGAPPVCQPGQPCQPQPGQVPPLGAVGSDPNALQALIAGALSGSAATLGLLTGGEMATLEQGIKMKAKTDAKGAKAEGQLMSAKLQQDGHAQASITLLPGSCYTVVGFGQPGVFAFQINLLTAPPMPPQVLAQSKADSVDPTVGPNETCVRNPYPTPLAVTVDMHVLKGQGLVGAQVYRK